MVVLGRQTNGLFTKYIQKKKKSSARGPIICDIFCDTVAKLRPRAFVFHNCLRLSLAKLIKYITIW